MTRHLACPTSRHRHRLRGRPGRDRSARLPGTQAQRELGSRSERTRCRSSYDADQRVCNPRCWACPQQGTCNAHTASPRNRAVTAHVREARLFSARRPVAVHHAEHGASRTSGAALVAPLRRTRGSVASNRVDHLRRRAGDLGVRQRRRVHRVPAVAPWRAATAQNPRRVTLEPSDFLARLQVRHDDSMSTARSWRRCADTTTCRRART